jgi:hypothetical protein
MHINQCLFLSIDARPTTHKPAPARTLNAGSGGIEFFLEIVESSKCFVDGILERTRLELAAVALVLAGGRRKILPEKGVVDVS